MKPLYALLLFIFFSTSSFANAAKLETAIFAGGCFWCMEPPFDKTPGVKETVSGYISGHIKNPTYKQVSSGSSGHIEAIKIVYDSSTVSYQQLLDVFWQNIDPVDEYGQFCDKGSQYISAIFYANNQEKQLAEQSIAEIESKPDFKQGIATKLIASSTFYPAESYHQNYYLKNPKRYKFYRWNCGRDKRLKELWGNTQ